MDIILATFKWIFNFITYLALVIQSYYLFLSIFGFYTKRRKEKENGFRKFAIVIPAHNEELVIGETVKAALKLDYPKELFDVYVISDNSTDSTSKVAREASATVIERNEPDKGGKAYALNYFFEKLKTMDKGYRSIAVLDADNIVHPNFLKEMNKKLNQGYKVAQGFLDSKNPYDSFISSSYAIEFWTTNRMLKLSRDNLGLSSSLGGTGFAMDLDIIEKFGWDTTCLTEDLEFTSKLVLNGYKVGWCHNARVYDESPTEFMQSFRQRKRWMQGYADVYSKYFWPLLKKAIKDFDFKAADCALCVIQPLLFILFGLNIIIMSYRSIVSIPLVIEKYMHFNFFVEFGFLDVLLGILLVYQTIYIPIQLSMDKKLSLKSIRSLILYPIYALTWIPAAVLGILNKNDKVWVHTKHSRAIKLDEIQKS